MGLEQWQFRIEGQFEPQLLRLAFEQVITRHTILRTGFSAIARGEPVQVVVPTVVLPWREQDCRELDADARRTELQRVLDQDAKTRFDLSCPPLMRVCLLRLADYEWQLLWTTHHLCIDGWSWPRLFKEIAEFYAALQEQRPASVEFAPDYGRYVGWLTRNSPSSPTYWKHALAGFAAPTPIALGSRAAHAPDLSAARPSELATSLSRETTGSLQLLARASGITLGTLVQAAWALLLAHYNESSDVVFGAAFSGRPDQLDGIETLIGPCVTNVPVRAKFDFDEPLQGWLTRLQTQQLDLNQQQYTPLDVIQGLSEIPWQSRLFDSLIVFQNYRVDAALGKLGRNARLFPVQAPEATNYPLTIAISPGEQLSLRLIYNENRLGRDTIEAIAEDLPAMLSALGASRPASTISDILDQMPAERRGKAAATAAAAQSARLQWYPELPQKGKRNAGWLISGASCWASRTLASTTTSSTSVDNRSYSCACTS